MREVMFRGKRIDNGEMVEGWLKPFLTNGYIGKDNRLCIQNGLYHTDIFEVNPETVGQYTGIKDNNGKKIFENDILKIAQTKNGSFYFGIVKFGTYIDDFDINDIKEHIGFYIEEKYGITGILSPKHDEWDSYKVIGNIFDNPELVEKED